MIAHSFLKAGDARQVDFSIPAQQKLVMLFEKRQLMRREYSVKGKLRC
jgi:hypothetical protein